MIKDSLDVQKTIDAIITGETLAFAWTNAFHEVVVTKVKKDEIGFYTWNTSERWHDAGVSTISIKDLEKEIWEKRKLINECGQSLYVLDDSGRY